MFSGETELLRLRQENAWLRGELQRKDAVLLNKTGRPDRSFLCPACSHTRSPVLGLPDLLQLLMDSLQLSEAERTQIVGNIVTQHDPAAGAHLQCVAGLSPDVMALQTLNELLAGAEPPAGAAAPEPHVTALVMQCIQRLVHMFRLAPTELFQSLSPAHSLPILKAIIDHGALSLSDLVTLIAEDDTERVLGLLSALIVHHRVPMQQVGICHRGPPPGSRNPEVWVVGK